MKAQKRYSNIPKVGLPFYRATQMSASVLDSVLSRSNYPHAGDLAIMLEEYLKKELRFNNK